MLAGLANEGWKEHRWASSMTPSEQLVFDLCRRSALSLWSFANPLRRDGRELCDALVVFRDHIVVFSVKEITLNENKDPEVAAQRWLRAAVDASIKQLIGAQRELASMTTVVRHDGQPGVELPPLDRRRVHLVAVAVGGKRRVPFAGGKRDDAAYVHVVDEVALREILGELDTAPELLEYLDAKESFQGTILCEGEENLFAVYLHGGRKLPTNLHLVMAQDGLWSEVQKKPEFVARKRADAVSYWWDERIEVLIKDYELSTEGGATPSEHERVVRTMAAETRFSRRILSSACLDWLQKKQRGARYLGSESGVGYVFSTYPRDMMREERVIDLQARCLVARSPSVLNRATIVGLATEIYDPSGYSVDALLLHVPDWTAEAEETAAEARQIFGIMQKPTTARATADEFPHDE